MRFSTLQEWLQWQEKLHPSEIELGLDRVRTVLDCMQLGDPKFTVISVAGTNGKGSSVAMLDAIYRQAGFQVGAYTSPHIHRYNERISINGEEVSDQALCDVFEYIDQCRGNISLTYFEFGTLAAIALFHWQKVDIALLEVGLGGRLDAVNILDADVALITSIGIDHQDWLGNKREQIAIEKAGIARPQRPTVCGDVDPPHTLIEYLDNIGSPLYLINRDYFQQAQDENAWIWDFDGQRRNGLPWPAMRGEFQLNNAASVLMVVQLLASRLYVSNAHIRSGLSLAIAPGRFQIIPGNVPVIVDVAHNEQAAQALASALKLMPCTGKTLAVFGVMRDKDVSGIINAMRDVVGSWYLSDLNIDRAMRAAEIQSILKKEGVQSPVSCYSNVKLAKESAVASALDHDRVLVFGSFYVVSEIL